jgi:hypothetical protein
MSKNEPKFRVGQLVWIIINSKLRSAKVISHFIDDEDGSYNYTVEFLSGGSVELYREVDLHGSPKHCIAAFTKSRQDEISHLDNRISRLKDEIDGASSSYIEECTGIQNRR